MIDYQGDVIKILVDDYEKRNCTTIRQAQERLRSQDKIANGKSAVSHAVAAYMELLRTLCDDNLIDKVRLGEMQEEFIAAMAARVREFRLK